MTCNTIKDRKRAKAWTRANPERNRERCRVWYRANKKRAILHVCKRRAKVRGVPFSLVEDDIQIPTVCPVFGTPLVIEHGKASANSPSVDRIVNECGYVPSNIVVVSAKANSIKGDRSLSDLQTRLADLKRTTIELERLVVFYAGLNS